MTSGWVAKTTPAVAVGEGCVTMRKAFGAPETVFKKPKVVESGMIPTIEAVPGREDKLRI